MNKLMFASVISEIQQSDVFMTVRARICETPAANLNGARVTEAFIDEIVGNEKRYVGLPLYADVKALIGGKYNRLGHLYDARSGEFHSTQIGSFYKFEKEQFENGSYLIGYARIPKRNKKLSKAISELFADGALKFSFEISVGEYEELDDNTILIDASENNYLEGTAIVTFPACEEAVALELVAQKADDAKGGESEMAEVEKTAEETAEKVETEATEVASEQTEEIQAEEAQIVAEEISEEEKPEEETADCKKEEKAEEETAEVLVREEHCEHHSVNAFDTETGVETRQDVTICTETTEPVEGNLVQATDGTHIAEEQVAEAPDGTDVPSDPSANDPTDDPADTPTNDETPSEEEVPVTDAVEKRKTAEQTIAELMDMVEDLKREIAELKEKKVVAEHVSAEVNPMMGEINVMPAYSLLSKSDGREPAEYSLLSKW